MTTSTLTPNGTALTSNCTVVGAATAHAALSDGSDSSYVDCGNVSPGGGIMYIDMTTFTIPTGAVIIAITNKFRAANPLTAFPAWVWQNGTSSHPNQTLTGSPANYTNLNTRMPATQADIDAFQLVLQTASLGGTDTIRFYEASVDVKYALKPTTTVTAPTGTQSTSVPTIAWAHTINSDGSAQTAYQYRVFTAAQYGIGGFDPATSPAYYDSGIVPSSSTSTPVGAPLTNSTTWRIYVRTAQSTLGAYQWADYTYPGSNFTTSFTTSDITSVVATAASSNAENQIVITRNAATPLWTSVEVQKSYDGGATWSYVRGYTRFTTPSTATVTLFDNEAPNGTAATYRARATYQVSGFDVTGAWVTSSSVTWSGTDLWLKDITTRANKMVVNNDTMPEPLYTRAMGVFKVIGSASPVVVTDKRQLGVSTITLETFTDAEAAALQAVCQAPVALLSAPSVIGWGHRYVVPGDLQELRKSQEIATPWRLWQLNLIEVTEPADVGIN